MDFTMQVPTERGINVCGDKNALDRCHNVLFCQVHFFPIKEQIILRKYHYTVLPVHIFLSYYSVNHTERRILVLTTNSIEVIALISRYAPAYLSFSIVFHYDQLRGRRKVLFHYTIEREFLFMGVLSINAAVLQIKLKYRVIYKQYL